MLTVNIKYAFFLFLGLLFLVCACEPQKDSPIDRFDRKALLQNLADNLIRPAYQDVRNEANTFHTAVQAFSTNPSETTLADLQQQWVATYTQWQYVNAYNFGPAGEAGLSKSLVEEVGTFPVNTLKMEEAMAVGTWNLNDFNRDIRGFLAVEYLIFGINQNNSAVLSAFASNPFRSQYLLELSDNIRQRLNAVQSEWSGPYAVSFVENAGTDVGSSTAQLYNEFVRSYESLKNFKLGLPLGKRTGQTQSEPLLVEAVFSGQSLPMLKAHFTAIENIWYGRSSKIGQDGLGFRAYLAAVEGGNALIISTESQMTALRAALNAVPESPALSQQIVGNPAPVEALYIECSKMTRFFKSDLSSLLGIAITFSSSDGD